MRVNVRTRHREQAVNTLGPLKGGACVGGVSEGAPGVADIVVTARGTAAWTIGNAPRSITGHLGPITVSVCVWPPNSHVPTSVAASMAIEPRSLATSGGHLYWTEGSGARSVAVR